MRRLIRPITARRLARCSTTAATESLSRVSGSKIAAPESPSRESSLDSASRDGVWYGDGVSDHQGVSLSNDRVVRRRNAVDA